MSGPYRYEPLGERHLPLRDAFSCGEPALDTYLKTRARKEVEQRLAVVRILYDTDKERIAGYYTLRSVLVEREGLPSSLTHRLARYESYPATLIGRLAVDVKYQGERVGGRLLLDALWRALEASREVASLAVLTDAKNDDVQGFYEHFGFELLQTEQHARRLFLPMATVEKLFSA